MLATVDGFIVEGSNPDLAEAVGLGTVKSVRNIHLRIIEKNCEKVKNIIASFTNSKSESSKSPANAFALPVRYAPEGGLLIRLSTQKLMKYVKGEMAESDPATWFNKRYKVYFAVNKVNLTRKNTDISIPTIVFILKSIDFYTFEDGK